MKSQASKPFQHVMSAVSLSVLILFIVLIRFCNLEADPSNWKRVGDIFDEGVWALNPRNAILFGQWFFDEQNTSLASPLFMVLLYTSFKFLGVSFFSARLVSAIFGVLTVILCYWALKKVYGQRVAFLGTAIFGLNDTFLMYNRLTLVETVIMFFAFLTFISWYAGRFRKIFFFLSGICFALTCLAKVFNIVFALPLFCVWLYENWDNLKGRKWREALAPVFLALAGFLIVVLPFYFFHYLPHKDIYVNIYQVFSWNAIHFSSLKDFLLISALGLSHALAEQIFTQLPVTLLMTAFILSALSWGSRVNFSVISSFRQMHPLIAYSFIFLVFGWLASIPFGFIDRRQIVFILPLCLIMTRVVSLVLWENKSVESPNPSRNSLIITLIILGYSIWTFFHVLWRKNHVLTISFHNKYLAFAVMICSITAVLIAIFFITKRSVSRQNEIIRLGLLLAALLLISLPFAESFKVAGEVLAGMGYLKAAPGFKEIYGLLILGIITIFVASLIRKDFSLRKIWDLRFATGFLVVYFIVNLTSIVLSLSNPSYTLPALSKQLGRMFPPGTVVKGPFTQTMCLDNKLYPYVAYQNSDQGRIPDRKARYILIAINRKEGLQKKTYIKGHEQLIATFNVMPYLSSNRPRIIFELYEDSRQSNQLLTLTQH